ncbi:MAG: N-acetylmuramoyl-L-alanine amidase [Phycisphaeraceae bacterium]
MWWNRLRRWLSQRDTASSDAPVRPHFEALEPRLLLSGSVYEASFSNVAIPDAGSWVYSTINIDDAPAGATITDVDVFFDIKHTYASDLEVDLEVQNSSANYRVWNREGGSSDDPSRTVNGIDAFDGLDPNRTWYLYARDRVAGDAGYIDDWWIEIHYDEPIAQPGEPTGLDPDNETISDLTPFFDWNSASNADSYEVNISQYPYGSSNIVYTKSGIFSSSHTVSSGYLEYGTQYRWDVTAVNSAGETTSDNAYFSIAGAVPSTPTAFSPGSTSSPGPVISDLTPNFDWSSESGADWYEVNIRNLDTNGLITQQVSSSQYTPSSPLASGTPYRWDVTAGNSSGESSPTTDLYFQTAAVTPSITGVSPDPVSGSDSAQPFTINGSNFDDDATVNLYDLRTGESFLDRSVSSRSSTQITINPNFTNNTADWRVEMVNPGGASDTYDFQVQATAVTPSITSVSPDPVPGKNGDQPFTITGSDFAPDATVNLYDLRTGEVFPDRAITSRSSTSLELEVNFTNQTADWRVEVVNGSAGSDTHDFRVEATTSSAPDLTVSEISVDKSEVSAGNMVQVDYTLENLGSAAGESVTKLRLVNPDDVTDVLVSDIYTEPAIDGHSSEQRSHSLTIPSDAAPGTYRVRLILDDESELNQSDEDNDLHWGPDVDIDDATDPPDGKADVFVSSPNYGPRPSDAVIDAIVIHTTEATYTQTINTFTNPDSEVSSHFVIESDGRITQMVDETDRAWHATYYNDRSIGIEMIGYAEDPNTWNDANISALEQLVADLVADQPHIPVINPDEIANDYGDGRLDAPGIVGHSQVQPFEGEFHGKSDPGAYFPWDSFIQNVNQILFDDAEQNSLARVANASDGLNLRSDPDLSAESLTVAPEGSFIQVLDDEPVHADGFDWLPVRYERWQGWAPSQYLSTEDGVDGSTNLADDLGLFSDGDEAQVEAALTAEAAHVYRLEVVEAGELALEIEAEQVGSTLDGYLRLFDAHGNELAWADDSIGTDPQLVRHVARGVYYVGVSSYAGRFYDPRQDDAAEGDSGEAYALGAALTAQSLPDPGAGDTAGALDLDGSFERNSQGLWVATGQVEINDVLQVQGQVSYDAQMNVSGSGEVWMQDVAGLGDVLLYEGAFDFPSGDVATNWIDGATSQALGAAGLDVGVSRLSLIEGGVRVEGHLELPEALGGVKVDFADSQFIDVTTEGVVYDFGVSASDLSMALPWAGIELATENVQLQVSNTGGPAEALLTGAFSVNWPGVVEGVTVNLSEAEDNYFRVDSSGDWDLVGALEVGEIDLGPALTLSDVVIDVDTTEERFFGQGTLALPLGSGVTAAAEFGIVAGHFDTVGLTFEELGVPIWSTPPVMLDTAGGTVSHLTPDEIDHKPVKIDVDLGLQLGPSVADYRLLYLDLDAVLERGGDLGGAATLTVGDPDDPLAAGTVTANWRPSSDRLSIAGDLTLGEEGDDIQVSGSMFFDDGDMYGDLAGSVRAPWWVGGWEIAEARAYAQIVDGEDNFLMAGGQASWVPAWAGGEQAVRVDLDTGEFDWDVAYSELDSYSVPALSGMTLMTASDDGVSTSDHGGGQHFDLPTGLESARLKVSWNESDSDFDLVDPLGNTYTSTDMDQDDAFFYGKHPDGGQAVIEIFEPAGGEWELIPTDAEAIGGYELSVKALTDAPVLSLVEPQYDVGGGPVTIAWTAEEGDHDAVIDLYRTPDRHGSDGTLIAEGLPVEGSAGEYVWDTSDAPTGEYYIQAVIRDGHHAPAVSYSTGQVTVLEDGGPEQVTGLHAPQGNDGSVALAWDDLADVDRYIVRVADKAWAEGYDHTYTVHDPQLLLEELSTGAAYRVTVAAVDSQDRVGPGSEPIVVVAGGATAYEGPDDAQAWSVFAAPGETYTAQVPGDEGSDFEAVNLPAGAAVDETGLLTWEVPEAANGWFEVLVHVTDATDEHQVHRHHLLADATTPTLAESTTGVELLDATSVRLNAPAGLDQVGPMQYQLQRDGEIISAWQNSFDFVDTGLFPNTPYEYAVRVRDASPHVQTSEWSGSVELHTPARTPGTPRLTEVTAHSAVVEELNAVDNPGDTQYAFWDLASGQYVDADGQLGVTPVWRTADAWPQQAINGLDTATTYRFATIARNEQGLTTEPGPAATIITRATDQPLTLLEVEVDEVNQQVMLIFDRPASLAVKDLRLLDSNGQPVDPTPLELHHTSSDAVVKVAVSLALDTGQYTLVVSGDGVQDIHGNPLDGDADGQAGGDFVAELALEGLLPDENLQAAIREALDLEADAPITADAMHELTVLEIDEADVDDLTGLEFAVNLSELRAEGNRIANLSPLAELTSLTDLRLAHNQISNLAPLAGLTELQLLDLDANDIADLSPLTDLTGLTELSIADNDVVDLGPLVSLPALNQLHVSDNPLDDPGQLSSLDGLTSLTASSIGLENFAPIGALTQLTSLSLSGNPLGDAEDGDELAALTDLRSLALSDTGLHDLSIIDAVVPQLETLILFSNRIHDLMPLENAQSLRELVLVGNVVQDLQPLTDLDNLLELHLYDNRAETIDPLLDLDSLAFVHLGFNLLPHPSNDPAAVDTAQTLQQQGVEVLGIPWGAPVEFWDRYQYLPLSIPDAGLAAAVRDQLQIPDEVPLVHSPPHLPERGDTASLIALDASSRDIENLDGIDAFSKLQTLDLSHNLIHDPSPLAALEDLHTLRLTDNDLTRIDHPAPDDLSGDDLSGDEYEMNWMDPLVGSGWDPNAGELHELWLDENYLDLRPEMLTSYLIDYLEQEDVVVHVGEQSEPDGRPIIHSTDPAILDGFSGVQRITLHGDNFADHVEVGLIGYTDADVTGYDVTGPDDMVFIPWDIVEQEEHRLIIEADFEEVTAYWRLTVYNTELGWADWVDFQSDAKIVDRHVFYNDSSFDGNDASANAQDDAAIAPDKQALLPGEQASFENYTSYAEGLNGIMLDIAYLKDPAGLSASDFSFLVGNSEDIASWTTGPQPAEVAVREGGGVDGTDRVTLIWSEADAVKGAWLQVRMMASDATGLEEADTFYFGNAIGETGNATDDAQVNAQDAGGVRENLRNFLDPAPIDDPYDFNRDGNVNAIDYGLVRENLTNFLNALELISPGYDAVLTSDGFGTVMVDVPGFAGRMGIEVNQLISQDASPFRPDDGLMGLAAHRNVAWELRVFEDSLGGPLVSYISKIDLRTGHVMEQFESDVALSDIAQANGQLYGVAEQNAGLKIVRFEANGVISTVYDDADPSLPGGWWRLSAYTTDDGDARLVAANTDGSGTLRIIDEVSGADLTKDDNFINGLDDIVVRRDGQSFVAVDRGGQQLEFELPSGNMLGEVEAEERYDDNAWVLSDEFGWAFSEGARAVAEVDLTRTTTSLPEHGLVRSGVISNEYDFQLSNGAVPDGVFLDNVVATAIVSQSSGPTAVEYATDFAAPGDFSERALGTASFLINADDAERGVYRLRVNPELSGDYTQDAQTRTRAINSVNGTHLLEFAIDPAGENLVGNGDFELDHYGWLDEQGDRSSTSFRGQDGDAAWLTGGTDRVAELEQSLAATLPESPLNLRFAYRVYDFPDDASVDFEVNLGDLRVGYLDDVAPSEDYATFETTIDESALHGLENPTLGFELTTTAEDSDFWAYIDNVSLSVDESSSITAASITTTSVVEEPEDEELTTLAVSTEPTGSTVEAEATASWYRGQGWGQRIVMPWQNSSRPDWTVLEPENDEEDLLMTLLPTSYERGTG